MINLMLVALMGKVLQFDNSLSNIIINALKPYYDLKSPPYFAAHMPLYIKTIFYIVVVNIPVAICKFIYPFNKYFAYFLIFSIIAVALIAFGVFLGFLQLMYSF